MIILYIRESKKRRHPISASSGSRYSTFTSFSVISDGTDEFAPFSLLNYLMYYYNDMDFYS